MFVTDQVGIVKVEATAIALRDFAHGLMRWKGQIAAKKQPTSKTGIIIRSTSNSL
jgi:hypothetical protein